MRRSEPWQLDAPRPSPAVLRLLLPLCTALALLLSSDARSYWYLPLEYRQGGEIDGLEGAAGVAVSPDGAHVYATGAEGSSLATFARESAASELVWLGVVRDGVDGVDGLDGAQFVAVSPDGRSVYTASAAGNAVAVFARDPESGALSFSEVQRNGAGGVASMAGPVAVAVSDDGRHLYVAARDDAAIVRFDRDPASGALTFAGAVVDGEGGVDGLGGVAHFVFSRDGRHLYAAGETDDAIAVFERDASTGDLSFVGAHHDGDHPHHGLDGVRHLAIGAESHLYAVSPEGVVQLRRDPATGALAFEARYSQSGTCVASHCSSTNPVDGLVDPSRVLVSGPYLYAWNPGGALVEMEIEPTSGELRLEHAFQPWRRSSASYRGPSQLAASPDGASLVLTSGAGDLVALFRTPRFRRVHGDPGPSRGVDVAVDGKDVYVANGRDGYTIEHYRRGTQPGELELVGERAESSAVSIAVHDRHLYAALLANESTFRVEMFERDLQGGSLASLGSVSSESHEGSVVSLPSAIEVSPDGRHVYVVGVEWHGQGPGTSTEFYGLIAIFARDPATGLLTHVASPTTAELGFADMPDPLSLTFSVQGDHAYVADRSRLAALRRHANGSLELIEAYSSAYDWGLAQSGVAVARDGRHVYAAYSNWLSLYSRDLESGALTLDEHLPIDVDGCTSVDVGAADDAVFVSCRKGLIELVRDTVSGRLAPVHHHTGWDEEDPFAGGNELQVVPGGTVFLAGYGSVATFVPEPAAGGAAALSALAWLARARLRRRARSQAPVRAATPAMTRADDTGRSRSPT